MPQDNIRKWSQKHKIYSTILIYSHPQKISAKIFFIHNYMYLMEDERPKILFLQLLFLHYVSRKSDPGHDESKVDQSSRNNFNCTAGSQSLLYKIYSNIGDVDAIYGVDTNTSMQTHKRLQLLQCEKEFHKALCRYPVLCTWY